MMKARITNCRLNPAGGLGLNVMSGVLKKRGVNMFFTETDKVRLTAITIDTDQIESADKEKVRAIIKNIESGNGYKPVKVFHDLDHDTYTLTEGLEVYMACWKLGHEWIEAEISF